MSKAEWDRLIGAGALVLAACAVVVSIIAIQHADDASRRAQEIAALSVRENLPDLSAQADLAAFELNGADTVIAIDARVFNDGGRPATLVRVSIEAVGGAAPTFDNLFKKTQTGSSGPFFSFPPFGKFSPSPDVSTPAPSLVALIEEPSSRRHDLKPPVRVDTGGIADFAVKIRLQGVVARTLDDLKAVVTTQHAVAVLKFFDQGDRAVAVTLWDCGFGTLTLTGKCGGTAFL